MPKATPVLVENQQILDKAIRVNTYADLPFEGVVNQVYRCADTKRYYRYLVTGYIELEGRRAVLWLPIESVLDVVAKVRKGEWLWFRNPHDCKYIDVRIDMRDGNCIIKNNRGEVIRLETLLEQGK